MVDALTFDRGRHHLKTGGELRAYQSDGYNHLFARGQATFHRRLHRPARSPICCSGYPTVTLLAANDNRQALRTWAVERLRCRTTGGVSSRLTINAGVRYEFNAPPYDADDRMRIFDLATLQLQQVGANGVPRSGLRRRTSTTSRRGVGAELGRHRQRHAGSCAAATASSTTAAR